MGSSVIFTELLTLCRGPRLFFLLSTKRMIVLLGVITMGEGWRGYCWS